MGVIPAVYGGSILDENIILSGISSDSLAAHLAVKLKAKNLFLLTDVDGILKSEKAHLPLGVFSISKREADLGDGMKEKVRRISYAVENGIDTYVLNGRNTEAILKLVGNKKALATKVIP
ncbi:MAG: hypothetical protein ACREBW_08255, partial [Candidatus Micrarchaeaceae archaeon]